MVLPVVELVQGLEPVSAAVLALGLVMACWPDYPGTWPKYVHCHELDICAGNFLFREPFHRKFHKRDCLLYVL